MKNTSRFLFLKSWVRAFLVLWAAAVTLHLTSTVSHAQCGFYDQATQPIRNRNHFGTIGQMTTNNLGLFVIGAKDSRLRHFGVNGDFLSQTQEIDWLDAGVSASHEPNMTIASNHNSILSLAMIEFEDIGLSRFNTKLTVRFWDNLSTSGVGRLSVSGSPVFDGTFPAVKVSHTFPNHSNGSWPQISGLESAMDDKHLYITFRQLTPGIAALPVGYYFCAVNIRNGGTNYSWKVTPFPMTIPGGGVAEGDGVPTVACNRWKFQQGSVKVAFPRRLPGGRHRPTAFTPNLSGGAHTSIDLPEPTSLQSCTWIRITEFDDFSGFTAFHHFYAYQNGAAAPTGGLYSTDESTVFGPITQYLDFYDPSGNLSPFLPAPGSGDGYATNSVYCAYKVIDPINANIGSIQICRQEGQNVCNIFTSNPKPRNWTLGANQMGVFSLITSAQPNKVWRSFKPFSTDIRENTFANGLCHLQVQGVNRDVRVGDLTYGLNDTLRIPNDPRDQSFKFVGVGGPISAPSLSAGIQGDVIVPEVNNGVRGHIILDKNAVVDLNSLTEAQLVARSNGSIEYNGCVFQNMNQFRFIADGNHQKPDGGAQRRGQVYINDDLSLISGSSLEGKKGHFHFKEAATQVDMAEVILNGPLTRVTADSTNFTFGSKHPSQGLIQIRGNGNLSTNTGQSVSFRWCTLSNMNQTLQTRPTGYRADILLNYPANVYVYDNFIQYVKTEVFNPAGDVRFQINSQYMIRDFVKLVWQVNDNSRYQHDILIDGNSGNLNWPFKDNGFGEEATDFRIFGFNVLDQNQVKITDNVLGWQGDTLPSLKPISSNHLGIWLSNGTNAAVTSNTIFGHGVGIYDHVLGSSNSFICSNSIGNITLFAMPRLPWPGIGIWQEGDQGSGFVKLNEVQDLDYGYIGGGQTAATLLENSFHHNYYGAVFRDLAQTILNGSHTGSDDYAGFNNFYENHYMNLQIQWDGLQQPEIGAPSHIVDHSTWGKNTFRDTLGGRHFVGDDLDCPVLNTPITGNSWTPAIHTGAFSCEGPSSDIWGINCYNGANSAATAGNFSCGGGLHAKEQAKKQGMLLNDIPDSLRLYYAALSYDKIDPHKARDTMRLYCELYPFATQGSGGLVVKGLGYTSTFTGQFPESGLDHWINQYEWLTTMYPRNIDGRYQRTVHGLLASSSVYFDRNLAANIWYNYMEKYTDSSSVKMASKQIKAIREGQEYLQEDTTVYSRMPIFWGTASVSKNDVRIDASVFPNPSTSEWNLGLNLSSASGLEISLLDIATGVTLWSIQRSGEKGYNSFSFQRPEASGSYMVKIMLNGATVTHKLVIE